MSGVGKPPIERHRFVVTHEESSQRLDRVLAQRLPAHSRAFLQKLIHDEHVTLNGSEGVPIKAGRLLKPGETIAVTVPAPSPANLSPEPIPLSILHEDRSILVLDKPAGLVVHPGAGARSGTLVHALLHHCHDLSGIGGVERPGIVHRLDKETSGVMVVAKNDSAHRDISRQFADRTITKIYHALVWGSLRQMSGEISVPIGRDRVHRIKISSRTATPREALTRYRVVERLDGLTWLELSPKTGRTHQIRVHLNILGHPIAGDRLYGGAARGRDVPVGIVEAVASFGRLALHASRLTLRHPDSGESVSFDAPLPEPFVRLLAALRG